MPPLAYIALGSAAWAAAHAWCHARYRALEAGDREGLAAGGTSGGDDLAAGIRRGDVSPDIAELALGKGLIRREDALRTRSGPYRRRYDRTAVADSAWLPAFVASAVLGAAASPAWAAMMGCVTWAAMADARFRVIPRSCAAAMAAASIACNGPEAMRAAALLALTTALLAPLVRLARASRSAFGAGDVVLTACCITALGAPRRWMPFAAALLAMLAMALIASSIGRRAAGGDGAGPTLVPFGCFAAPALACALAASI